MKASSEFKAAFRVEQDTAKYSHDDLKYLHSRFFFDDDDHLVVLCGTNPYIICSQGAGLGWFIGEDAGVELVNVSLGYQMCTLLLFRGQLSELLKKENYIMSQI